MGEGGRVREEGSRGCELERKMEASAKKCFRGTLPEDGMGKETPAHDARGYWHRYFFNSLGLQPLSWWR